MATTHARIIQMLSLFLKKSFEPVETIELWKESNAAQDSETVITSTTPTTSSSSSAQYEPQQSGLAANCDNFYDVQSGDSCDAIESEFGITAAQFSSWNPSINSGMLDSSP